MVSIDVGGYESVEIFQRISVGIHAFCHKYSKVLNGNRKAQTLPFAVLRLKKEDNYGSMLPYFLESCINFELNGYFIFNYKIHCGIYIKL